MRRSASATRSSSPSTRRATSTTCTPSGRPSGRASSEALKEAGIACAAYYTTPLHLQPALAHLGWRPGSLPETERAAAENLVLPLWGGITPDVQEQVVETVLAAASP